ncbi:hypothetical protein CHS0354_006828 [Potamilus streckersoni]|uniref:Cytochrome c domain-containing protein n=1 Tax=Potamilus streckersoni TaxID=2493646 RepID=A0AAE0TE88_9BIVA|nr:hypothetical protein CHS0354_006828 [Potamilus streckersoni]
MTVIILPLSADDKTVKTALKSYEAQGAKNFSAEKGKQMWTQEFTVDGEKRTCATCHMTDLTKVGKRADTGKAIDPMSAKANPQRYTDINFIEKWFKRNCKWTWGREFSTAVIYSDDDEDEGYENYREKNQVKKGFFSGSSEAVPATTNAVFKKECGECQFSYKAALLPARSWQRMMSDKELADHFGEELDYDATTKQELLKYMQANAAENVGNSKVTSAILKSVKAGDAPLKISELSYIIRKHDDFSAAELKNNPKVKTLGNCAACHMTAEQGNYHEDNVKVPR